MGLNWKQLSAAGAMVATLIGGVEVATGAVGKIVNNVTDIAPFATRGYVDGEITKVAGGVDAMSKQLNVLGGIVADQTVRQMELMVTDLQRQITEKEAVIRALPDNLSLKSEKAALDRSLKQAESDLQAAKCARVKVQFGPDIDCQNRF